MKKSKYIAGLLLLVAALFIIAGCTTAGVETPPGSGQYQTNTIVNPKITAGIETALAANAATAPVNPYAPLIQGGLVALSSVLGVFATWANNRRKENSTALKTVVAGVEQGGDQNTKKAIYTIATANGSQPLIESVVNPTAK